MYITFHRVIYIYIYSSSVVYYKIIIRLKQTKRKRVFCTYSLEIFILYFILVRYECTGVIHNPLLDQLYAFLIVPRLIVHRKKECPELRSAGSVHR